MGQFYAYSHLEMREQRNEVFTIGTLLRHQTWPRAVRLKVTVANCRLRPRNQIDHLAWRETRRIRHSVVLLTSYTPSPHKINNRQIMIDDHFPVDVVSFKDGRKQNDML